MKGTSSVLWYFIQSVFVERLRLCTKRESIIMSQGGEECEWTDSGQLRYHHLLITRAHITNKDWARENKQRTHGGGDNTLPAKQRK